MMVVLEMVIIFIEQLLILMLLELFCIPNKDNNKRIIIAAIILTLCSQISNELLAKHFLVNIIPFLIVGTYTFLFLKGTIVKKIYITLLIVINVLMVNILFLVIGTLFNSSAYQLIYNGGLVFGYMLAIASKIFQYLEYSYLKNYLDSENQLNHNTWKFIIGILMLSLVCIGFTLNEFVNFGIHSYYTGIIVITFILVNLLIFRLCIMVSKHANENANQKLLLESIRYETKLLDVLQEKKEEINRVNHDFKNHIATVNKLILDGEQEVANEYLSGIKIPEMMDYIHTPNTVLNYILNEKISLAKRKGIDVRYSGLCDEHCDYIDNIDITIILGNLLDNAIEGCTGVEDPTIDIGITMDICSCMFEIKNTSKEVIMENNSKLITTKDDKKNHGFGMLNIKKSVEKYRGDDFYGYHDGVFTHVCMLNNPKQK